MTSANASSLGAHTLYYTRAQAYGVDMKIYIWVVRILNWAATILNAHAVVVQERMGYLIVIAVMAYVYLKLERKMKEL